MPRSRPAYPQEFRAEAIRLVKTSGVTIAQIAKDLGINDQTLRNWVRQADVDTGLAPATGDLPSKLQGTG